MAAGWRARDLRDSYDVVIVGAGVHGLATAYYLASRWGITNVAVIDKGYIGGGGSGRNTAIVRSNYLTPEGVTFYDRSVKLYEQLAAELNFNVMFSQRGHLTLAHNDSSLRTMRWRAEVNKLQGVESEVIGPDEIARLVPFMDVSEHTRYPILGALYHPPGGTIRHDAVNWGYARGADAMGIEIHQQTELTGIDVVDGEVVGVTTSRGHIATPVVVNCTAGWSSLVAAMAGVALPITHPPARGGRHRAGQAVPRAPSWSPARSTSTSARPIGVSSCSGPARIRSRRTRCGARWPSARSWPAMCWS